MIKTNGASVVSGQNRRGPWKSLDIQNLRILRGATDFLKGGYRGVKLSSALSIIRFAFYSIFIKKSKIIITVLFSLKTAKSKIITENYFLILNEGIISHVE